MMITVTEAATILGITPRAVRARLARGELRGHKDDGHWKVSREALPRGPGEIERRGAAVDEIRLAVDAALPPRERPPQRSTVQSVADLRSFQAGHALLSALRQEAAVDLAQPREALERGLIHLALAWHEFDADRRIDALVQARAAFSRAAALLLLRAPAPTPEPTTAWVGVIEQEVLPPLAGLFRRAEGAYDRPHGRRA